MSTKFITVARLIEMGEASIQTGPFGTQLKASEYVEEGTPVINVRNVGLGDVRDHDLEFIDERKTEKLSEHILKVGDIVFGRKGAVERHGLITQKEDGWVQGSDCLRLRLSGLSIDQKFASFYFRTQGHQSWMQALCSFGATMASLNQDIVKRISIPHFPLHIQKKIAAILTAYDDLIENNKRRIRLLEKMAEEIYREWFVRMRFPGHQKTKCIKGIPEGWAVRDLDSIASINATSIKKDAHFDTIRYIDIGSVTTNHISEVPEIPFSEAPGRARRTIKHGDIIWSSVRPANRAYALILHPFENMIVSTGFAVIRPRSGTPYSFIKYATTTNSFVEQMTLVAKGAAYPATSFDDFKKAKILYPTSELLEAFHEIAGPIFEETYTLNSQNANLTKTRDLLLPRLISGKLSVEALDIQFPPSMHENEEPKSNKQKTA